MNYAASKYIGELLSADTVEQRDREHDDENNRNGGSSNQRERSTILVRWWKEIERTTRTC